jgi:hypothetical protein
MVKRKWTKNDLQNITQKLRIGQHEPHHKQPGDEVNPYALVGVLGKQFLLH